MVQVGGDAGLLQHRLDDGLIRVGLAVGDGHLAKRDALFRPVEAGAHGLAHLGDGVGGRHHADGIVGRCRGEVGAEDGGAEGSEGRGGLLLGSRGVGELSADPFQPRDHVLIRLRGLLVEGREEDGDRHPLGDGLDQALGGVGEVGDAVDEQGRAVEEVGVRHGEGVGAVPRVAAGLGHPTGEVRERVALLGRLGRRP